MSLLSSLHDHVIHMLVDVVLLALVVLWRRVVISRLLLLRSLPLSIVVELAWSLLCIPLGTVIGVVTSLATSEACVTSSGNRGVVPHRCPSRSVLKILRETRALH